MFLLAMQEKMCFHAHFRGRKHLLMDTELLVFYVKICVLVITIANIYGESYKYKLSL